MKSFSSNRDRCRKSWNSVVPMSDSYTYTSDSARSNKVLPLSDFTDESLSHTVTSFLSVSTHVSVTDYVDDLRDISAKCRDLMGESKKLQQVHKSRSDARLQITITRSSSSRALTPKSTLRSLTSTAIIWQDELTMRLEEIAAFYKIDILPNSREGTNTSITLGISDYFRTSKSPHLWNRRGALRDMNIGTAKEAAAAAEAEAEATVVGLLKKTGLIRPSFPLAPVRETYDERDKEFDNRSFASHTAAPELASQCSKSYCTIS